MLKLANDPSQELCTTVQDVPKPASPALVSEASPVLEGFLRREELARQLGVTTRTIDRWQALREGPPRVHVGRTILYNVESVRLWLGSREEQSSYSKTGHNFPRTKRHSQSTAAPHL